MHQLFRYKKIIGLVCATLILIWIITLTTKTREKISFPEKVVGYIVMPIQKAFDYITLQANEAYMFFYQIGADKQEKERLSLRVNALEDEIRKLNDVSKENERLKQMLNIKQEHKNFVFESAEVIGRNPENWNSIILINKGSDNGITVNSAVLSINNGLVGKVIEVGPVWAKVMLITDTNSSVSCFVDRTRDLGVVRGDIFGTKYGYIKLQYMLPDADIVTDDLIITSGFGGIFPKGILIGKVKEVKQEKGDLTKYSYIEPVADFKTIEEVLVIKTVK